MKECTKRSLCDANYDRENNNSTNASRPRRFEVRLTSVMFPQTFYVIVLPVKFFPKYYFNELRFKLLQNVTSTDE